jgi:hypothetical protein
MWGAPDKGRLGIIPTVMKVAKEEKAYLVYWSAGFPEKGGRDVAPNTFDYAVRHAGEFKEYTDMTLTQISGNLSRNAIVDVEPQTTRHEVERAFPIFYERGIERVIMVSAPKHIFRVHQEGLRMQERDAKYKHFRILATASDVDFPNTRASDVVMMEPPHRSDQPLWQTHRYAREVFTVMGRGEDEYGKFLGEWGELLKKHGAQVTWTPRV